MKILFTSNFLFLYLLLTTGNTYGACNHQGLINCLDYLGGEACFEEFSCPVSCQSVQLEECLHYGGGEACYSKWFCNETQESGLWFGEYYRTNYSQISAKVKKFHQGSFGCAAFASTALKEAGFSITQVKVTNDLERQLIKLNWNKITDLTSLVKGDVVFTTKSTSNLPGTYSHVYVFQAYSRGRSEAYVTDNYGAYVRRNIFNGPRSPSVIAYRSR